MEKYKERLKVNTIINIRMFSKLKATLCKDGNKFLISILSVQRKDWVIKLNRWMLFTQYSLACVYVCVFYSIQ